MKRLVARMTWATFGIAAAACGARTALIAESIDASAPIDGSIDVRRDGTFDVVPIDVLPPIDVVIGDHIVPLDCPDASDTRVYLFTSQNELYSFYPPNLAYKKIGSIACPNAMGSPYSMGVDRNGVAYGLFNSGWATRAHPTAAKRFT